MPSLPAGYFDDLYAREGDPWRYETSDYERGKYDDTIAALNRPAYPRALEAGCSIGVLTERLAQRCETLVSLDPAEAALARARERLAGRTNVTFLKAALPDGLPEGPFDLIVLSEVLYYLDASDLDRAADRCLERLSPDGQILMVHWLGETPDYPLTGDEAADRFLSAIGGRLTTGLRLRRPQYRLERLERPPR